MANRSKWDLHERERRLTVANERKAHAWCEHKAGKSLDGNLIRCIGCGEVVGLFKDPKKR